MPTAPPPILTCENCQSTLDPNNTCPRCRAPEDWQDQLDAVDFVMRRLKEWHQAGKLTDHQLQALSDVYDQRKVEISAAAAARTPYTPSATFARRDECWSCKGYLYTHASHCQDCGAPLTDPGVRSLRYLEFLNAELHQHVELGRLTLRQGHEFQADLSERISALRRNLERGRAPFVLPIAEEPASRPRRHRREESLDIPRRTVLEVLLDPHSIQWLLAAGGALIVLGLVIWLVSIGLFENAGFVAIGLGLGNAALLAGGFTLILRTTNQNAGRALTLLACLVMPLNLWFYHTHNLITLDHHLWVAALFCCMIYIAAAWVLKDSLFVYVLVAGTTLTGLLFLAQINHFGEVLAPATFFIVLGLICLHAERAFPEIDGPFSRQHFGMAFYWSSIALMGVGFFFLLAAQVIGWMHRQIFRNEAPFDVVSVHYLPWTLSLVLAGAYACFYADLVVRKIGSYIYGAGLMVLWAEIQVLVMLDVGQMESVIIIALSLTALGINLFQISFESHHAFLRRVAPLGLLMSILPIALGTLLHFRATNNVLNEIWPFEITWTQVAATAVAALTCRAGAHLYRHKTREVSVVYFFLTAAATLLFAAALAWMIGMKAWEVEAPLLMVVPILYLFASHLYRGHTPERPLIWAAHGTVILMLLCSLWVALGITSQVRAVVPPEGKTLNLLLALFCLETAFFYGLAAFFRRTNWTIYFATVMLCGAIWQFLKFFGTPDELYTVAFTLPGFILLVIYRFGMFEKMEWAGLDRTTFQSANALTTLGFASGALLSLSRLFLNEQELARLDPAGDWQSPLHILLYLLAFLTIISIASAFLVQHQAWRRTYVVLCIINAALLILIIHKLSTLSPWQRLEIFSVIVGIVMLVFAYVGWFRETERSSDLVTMAFIVGSLALAFPLFLAAAIHRFVFAPSALDELALVAACALLFGTGILCRIRATTIVGSACMLLYILMVLAYMHRFLRESYLVGIYLTLAGVLLFGSGLLLSVFRDRLLALPDKARRHEGIFRIFDWR